MLFNTVYMESVWRTLCRKTLSTCSFCFWNGNIVFNNSCNVLFKLGIWEAVSYNKTHIQLNIKKNKNYWIKKKTPHPQTQNKAKFQCRIWKTVSGLVNPVCLSRGFYAVGCEAWDSLFRECLELCPFLWRPRGLWPVPCRRGFVCENPDPFSIQENFYLLNLMTLISLLLLYPFSVAFGPGC